MILLPDDISAHGRGEGGRYLAVTFSMHKFKMKNPSRPSMHKLKMIFLARPYARF
ncbi:hypothetical protein YGAWVPHU_CDS0015 [Salmonella phage SeKF_13]